MTIIDCVVAFAFGFLLGWVVGFALGSRKKVKALGSFAYTVGPTVQKGK